MKATLIILFVLIMGVILSGYSFLASDLNSMEFGTQINRTIWEGEYNESLSQEINGSLSKTVSAVQNLGDTQKGWVTKLVESFISVPQVIIEFVSLGFVSISWLGNIITSIGAKARLPPEVSYIAIVVILILIIASFIKLINKSGEGV